MSRKRKALPIEKKEPPGLGRILFVTLIGWIASIPFTAVLGFWPFAKFKAEIIRHYPEEVLLYIQVFAGFLLLFGFAFFFLWGKYSSYLFSSLEDSKTTSAYLGFIYNSFIMLFSVIFYLIVMTAYRKFFDEEGYFGMFLLHSYFYVASLILYPMTAGAVTVISTRKIIGF